MPESPNVTNYLIGKGIIYFDRFDDGGNSTGELDLGNGPAFALAPENEVLDHYSSREEVKKLDLQAIISSDLGVKFTLDEFNVENLNLAFQGDGVQTVSQGDGVVNNEAIVARSGRYVKLVYRKIAAGSVTVTDSTGGTTYVEGTDYTVDYTTGRIFTITAGNISNGEALLVDYTYQQAAYPSVYPATNTKVEGLFRFKGNSTFGSNFEIVIWKCFMTVTGTDINFISDDWSQVEFTLRALDDTTNHPNNPYGIILDIEGDTAEES